MHKSLRNEYGIWPKLKVTDVTMDVSSLDQNVMFLFFLTVIFMHISKFVIKINCFLIQTHLKPEHLDYKPGII